MNPEIFGINNILFVTFYFSASSLVGFLGAGQLFLIVKNWISYIFFALMLILSVGLIISLLMIPLPTMLSFVGELGEDLRIVSNSYPYSTRIYAILLASIGGTALLLGSVYSFIRDRSRYYTLFFSVGALMPMLRNIPFGYLGNELVGVILFFIGFVLSIYYLKKQEKKSI